MKNDFMCQLNMSRKICYSLPINIPVLPDKHGVQKDIYIFVRNMVKFRKIKNRSAENIMIEYMKKHENYLRDMLEKHPDEKILKELSLYHDKQIQWMQHERLVHLIVMLFVCLFTLLIFGFAVIRTSVSSIILSLILLGLSIAYIIHYYRLENSVQKWYLIANEIRRRF
jgi:hypothetical protein